MDFRQIKYFIAVAEEENIGRAAKRLNISQPPLTRQIKQIEEELNVSLFTRTPKGMEITPVGALFLEEARNILSTFELATERAIRASRGEVGRFDIAIFGSAILDTIPKILLAFKDRFPDVTLVFHQMTKGEQLDALRQRRINVGFNRFLSPAPGIRAERILQERLYIAMSTTHPLAHLDRVPLKVISESPLIVFPTAGRPNFIDKVISICHGLGFLPNIRQEVGDGVTAVALAASGFGLCLVPNSLTTLTLPGVTFRPISDYQDSWSVDLSCIYRENDPSPILRAFLETARIIGESQTQSHDDTY
ncbi:MAG: LysR family transcriptional regulator [Rhodospirillum sp.]|nr:LysR family transcriptional regulator [Rhodospirillum sp.]MCF8488192.1 LysR family transcriptional regulator [Rhodospirillum sp.]MCF8501379.1 LysR family transcriptional regulator [Rhodospirillum sp.]